MTLGVGSTVGPYAITGPLGKGGMGEVWRAHDSRLGRDVAIKALPAEFAGDSQRLARFEREAKVLASMNHPHIAAIYGVEDADHQRFLVLELVDGETLAERVARGPIPFAEAMRIALQIAEAIDAAHEKDIIHRDLKPANIKLTADGNVKVLDFGLAKAFESSTEPNVFNSPTLSLAATAQGAILGTAAYMSPEQARGQVVDRRTDIWAFGCVVYEMLTGRHAFRGEHVSDILASVLAREPEMADLPRQLPPRLTIALQRCFEKNPKRRWQAIGDLRVELEQILADPTAGAVAPARMNRAAVLLAAAAATLIAAPVAWFVKPAPTTAPRPIVRFEFEVPAGQTFRNTGRATIAVSPDGRHFAYNTAAGVYLRSMDTLAARVIPGTEGPMMNPFFSPDGEWLAYWSIEEQALQKISIGGGAPVTIAPARVPFGASWGRDGNILLGQGDSIVRVSADGGTPATLFTFKDGAVPFGPSLLPDGQTILYSLTRATGRPNRWDLAEIVAQRPDGEPKVLLRGGADARYIPTGHLVYSAGNVLYAVAFDADSLEVTGGPVPLVTGVQRATGAAVNTGAANYGVSDVGALVFLGQLASADTPQGGLGLVDRAGVVKMLDVPKANYRSPRVSPDGRRIVVETITDTSQNAIWVYELSGASAIRRLTQEGNNSRPVWTSDGRRIAYGQMSDKGAGIFWQPADGSGLPERLTTAPDGQFDFPESFSPDGKVLSFARVRPPLIGNSWGLWTVDLSSNEHKTATFLDLPNSNEFGSAFSPDGKWLAYASNADPDPTNPSTNFAVYVQPYPPTGAKYQISQTAGTWPIWAAGARELIYRPNVDAGGSQRLNVVTISMSPTPAFTSEKTLPIEGFLPVVNYREYDILPDGKRLIMVFPADRKGNTPPPAPRIHTVLNWTEELQARVPTKAR